MLDRTNTGGVSESGRSECSQVHNHSVIADKPFQN